MNVIDPGRRLRWADSALIIVYLLGLYTSINLQITATIPFPAAIAGVAGLLMLWRRRDRWEQKHLVGLMGVIAFFLATILLAPDWHFLGKRFTGLVQLVYSLVIGYALFLTLLEGERKQVANLFLGFCIAIVIGCLLEQYGGLRPLSDSFRKAVFTATQVYDADLRDMVLYQRIRPKLFTSEPSAVTFAYTFFSFCWYMFYPGRRKFIGYLALLGIGLLGMPGPTLLLMLVLAIPYEMFLGGKNPQAGVDVLRMMKIGFTAVVLLTMTVGVGKIVYSARVQNFQGGKDASFFFRQTGPALVARNIVKKYPLTGAGLTGEPFIQDDVEQVYLSSPQFDYKWKIPKASEVLTNYFWLHWIYLGVGFGLLAFAVMTAWLRMLGVPSILFCWSIWLIFGQAAGAYVGPRTWTILLIPAAAAVMHRYRAPVAQGEAESVLPGRVYGGRIRPATPSAALLRLATFRR